MALEQRRLIRLRYDGRCSVCSRELRKGGHGWWDSAARSLTCEMCGAVKTPSELPIPHAFDPGTAGGSARREHERRRAKDLESAIRLHPRTWKFRNRRKQTTDAWSKGAIGEELVGELLDGLRPEGIIAFHDRRFPGSRANIDHVAVAPSGIHVIDAKRYKGKRVQLVQKGWFFDRTIELRVGGRNCTHLVEKMAKQVLAVDGPAGELVRNPPTPITAVLCFVEGEFDLLGRRMDLEGVHIRGPRGLRKLLRRPGPLNTDQIEQIASRVAQLLPPA